MVKVGDWVILRESSGTFQMYPIVGVTQDWVHTEKGWVKLPIRTYSEYYEALSEVRRLHIEYLQDLLTKEQEAHTKTLSTAREVLGLLKTQNASALP